MLYKVVQGHLVSIEQSRQKMKFQLLVEKNHPPLRFEPGTIPLQSPQLYHLCYLTMYTETGLNQTCFLLTLGCTFLWKGYNSYALSITIFLDNQLGLALVFKIHLKDSNWT